MTHGYSWLFLGKMLLVVCAIFLLCRLGFWQISRAHYKQATLAQQHAQAKQPVLSSLQSTPVRFQRLALKSQFDNTNILLDNKIFHGQAGYQVITPLYLDSNTRILVNRGWIPLGRSRARLPTLTPLNGEVLVEGYLDVVSLNPLLSSTLEQQSSPWPRRLQQLDLDLVSTLLEKAVYPMVLQLDKTSPYAFQIEESNAFSANRHRGYALQWFSLAALLLCYAIYLLRKK